MVRTLHRPPVGGETPDDLDFLEGIDLHGAHQRERRNRKAMTGVLVALALLAVLGAIVTTVLLSGTQPSTDTYPDSGHRPMTYELDQPTAAHDSWAAPATAAYHAELDLLHDSGHRPLPTGTTTEVSLARDSWLPPALAEHDAQLRNTPDSTIEQAIEAWTADLADVHDSRIDLLLAS